MESKPFLIHWGDGAGELCDGFGRVSTYWKVRNAATTTQTSNAPTNNEYRRPGDSSYPTVDRSKQGGAWSLSRIFAGQRSEPAEITEEENQAETRAASRCSTSRHGQKIGKELVI